ACGTGGGCGPCGGPAAAADAPASEPVADDAAGTDEARTDLVRVRRRGAGTELAPNA
ncbi:biotin synthase BioB, partial [Kitasatospora paranensis]